ncbi:MAG: energy transducer TonB [Lutibacter sp.]|uniref:hypothetical protein n=1 Tax=Lutibacter sp. TaxID=1925666 RepID=UPI00385D0379
MKKIIYLLIILLSINKIDAQSEEITETFPIYKGCEKEKNKRKCFSKKINSHFLNKFRTNQIKNITPGIKKIYIIFSINKMGEIDNLKIRAPHKDLELETKRVLQLIPKFVPGTINNKPTSVKYSLPLAVRVEMKKPHKIRKTPWQ